MDFFKGGKKHKLKRKKNNPVLKKFRDKIKLIKQTEETPHMDYHEHMQNIYYDSNKGGLMNILRNDNGIIRGKKRILNNDDIETMFKKTCQQSHGQNLLNQLGSVFMIGHPEINQEEVIPVTYNRNVEPELMLKYLNNKTGRGRNTRKRKKKGKSKSKKKLNK